MTAKPSKLDNDKNKWEKERRNRLNDSFNNLAKLLPCYDPSITISKTDILIKSHEYINQLKGKIDQFLSSNEVTKLKGAEIKELHARITNLTTRNKQLTTLLKDANITIPTEYGELFTMQKPKKWSGKITTEKAIELGKIESQKENKNSTSKKKRPSRKKKSPLKTFSQDCSVNVSSGASIMPSAPVNTATSNIAITNIQPIQPCYLIGNNMSSKITTQPTTVLKNVISSPILSTLINPPLILNATPASNTLIVVKTSKTEECSKNVEQTGGQSNDLVVSKKLPLLRPKRRPLNKLIQTNALATSRFQNSFILWPAMTMQVVAKRRPRVIRKKVKKTDNSKKVNAPCKVKIQENKLIKGKDVKKTSDYSITALCKEDGTNLNNTQLATTDNCDNNLGEFPNVEKSDSKRPVTNKESSNSENLPIFDNVASNNLDRNISQKNAENAKELKPQENKKPPTNCSQVQDTLAKQASENNIKLKIIEPKLQNADLEKPNIIEKTENTSKSDEAIDKSIMQKKIVQDEIDKHQTESEMQIHSELSNDLFASLNVQGNQNPECTSPTAAFLNAFPLVSSFTGVKVTEVMEDETTDSPHGTPTLLQIGNLDASQKPNQNSNADNLTPSIMNLDNFNFFNSSLYNNFESVPITTTATTPEITLTNSSVKAPKNSTTTRNSKLIFPNQEITRINHVNNINKSYHVSDNIEKCTQTKVLEGNNNSSQNKQFRYMANNQQQTSQIQQQHRQLPQQQQVQLQQQTLPQLQLSQPQQTQLQQQPTPAFNNNINNTNNGRNLLPSNTNSNVHRYNNEYNTFNPFELPKTTQSFIKNYESSYVNTNCNYNYQSVDSNYQLCKNYYEGNNSNFYGNTLSNTNTLNGNNDGMNTISTSGNKKVAKEQPNKSMINWMAPEFSTPAPTISKGTTYTDFNQTNYLNTNTLYTPDYQNSATTTFATTTATEAHQDQHFPWSPTKLPQLLDPPHNFTSSTLPTLVGDLALGIGSYSNTNQMCEKKSKVQKKLAPTYEANFLSVSQLVDHNKDTSISTASQSSRISSRRNSGTNRSKQQAMKQTTKRQNVKEKDKSSKSFDSEWDAKRNKYSISNYSAESLIGVKQQNYPKTIPPYLPENILPYFPPNIDDNFSQPNQNHQNTTFGGNYNNTFMPPPTTSAYLQSSNFIPDVFDNPIENIFSHSNPVKNINLSNIAATNKKSPPKSKDNQFPAVTVGTNANSLSNNTSKSKTKKKDTFVDLSFLSMPSMNSPLLPDDYHSNFLAPPPPPNANQLYSSCKNPLYKQGSSSDLGSMLPMSSTATTNMSGLGRSNNIQHTDISPAPGSLTNFNLCTIFPEMNKTNNTTPSEVFRNYPHNVSHKNPSFLPNLE